MRIHFPSGIAALTFVVLVSAPAARAAPPDIVGFRTGLQAEAAYQMLQKYAGPSRRIQIGHQNIPELSAKPIIHEMLMSDGDPSTSGEVIELDLTLPPSPQTVWRIVRRLQFQPGKELLPQDVIATLRQKYGAEAQMPMSWNRPGFWWFTPDGQRAPLPHGTPQFADCNAVGPQADIEANVDMPNVMLWRPLPGLNPVQEPCRSLVKVDAQMGLVSVGGLVHWLTVEVADLSLQRRTNEATVAHLAHDAAARDKQSVDIAHSREKPTL